MNYNNEKIAICGVPESGKTTFSKKISNTVNHTDDLLHLPWGESVKRIAKWFDNPNKGIVYEGVSLIHALERWMSAHPGEKPVDRLFFFAVPISAPPPKSHKGITTQVIRKFNEIRQELEELGVKVENKII